MPQRFRGSVCKTDYSSTKVRLLVHAHHDERGMMSTTAPAILLLDVDGVLNALNPKSLDGWRQGTFKGYLLKWDPSITARLKSLHDRGLIEIQWLTTWSEDADELLADQMGLPRGLIVHPYPQGSTRGWWKFDHARDVVDTNQDRPVVWIDDDLDFYAQDVYHWVDSNDNVFTVCPDLLGGLTHNQIDDIEEWLDSRSGTNNTVLTNEGEK